MARHRAVTLDAVLRSMAMATVCIIVILPILSVLFFQSIQPIVILESILACEFSILIVYTVFMLLLPLWWVRRAHRLLNCVPGLYERGIQLADFLSILFIPYGEITGIIVRSRLGIEFLNINVRPLGHPFTEYAGLLGPDDLSLLRSIVRQGDDGPGRPALRLYGAPQLPTEGEGEVRGDALPGTGTSGPSMGLKY